MLVSGLNIGSAWYDQLSIQTFVDYVTGQLGGPKVNLITYYCKRRNIVCRKFSDVVKKAILKY